MIGAMISEARVPAHNTTLEVAGFGPDNFSVPVRNSQGIRTHTALLYAGRRQDFIDAVKALLGVQVVELEFGEPLDMMDALTGGRSNWGWSETEQAAYAEWVQPTGAQDAYKVGDRVMFNDQAWENRVNNNLASPAVSGWVLL